MTLGLEIRSHLLNLGNLLRTLGSLDLSHGTMDLSDAFREILAKKVPSSWDLAQLIAASYSWLSDKLSQGASKEGTRVVGTGGVKEFRSDQYRSNFANPVICLRKFLTTHLKDYLVGFYVHGSLSTLDYCDYSDLDTLMIVKKSVIENPRRLHSLQPLSLSATRFLYMVDIFQHHGHFAIAEQDLEYFPESYFPPVLFRYSTALLDVTDGVNIRQRESEIENQHALWRMCYSFRESHYRKRYPKNNYTVKSYLSRLMLLPALYLQCKGRSCYKKFSFEEASHDFDPAVWEAIKTATAIREEWQSPTLMSWYRRLLAMGCNRLMIARVGRVLSGRIPDRLERRLNGEFYENAACFAEELSSYLREGKVA
jgi:hypothetical protein